MKLELEFHEGIPDEDGWYLVELDQPGLVHDTPYEVDFCRASSNHGSCGREWISNYVHTVRRWAKLPQKGQP